MDHLELVGQGQGRGARLPEHTHHAAVEELSVLRRDHLLVVEPDVLCDAFGIGLPLHARFIGAREPRRLDRERRQVGVWRRSIGPDTGGPVCFERANDELMAERAQG